MSRNLPQIQKRRRMSDDGCMECGKRTVFYADEDGNEFCDKDCLNLWYGTDGWVMKGDKGDKVVGFKIEATDRWGGKYEETFLVADAKQDFPGLANYALWATGKFLERVAGYGNQINADNGCTYFFRLRVFDMFTVTEIMGE